MKNSGTGAAFRSRAIGTRRSVERVVGTAGLSPHALLLLALLPCVAIAAFLLSDLQARERTSLEQSARTRAEFTAASIDQSMLGLIRTLKALPPVSLTSAEDRNVVYACANAALENTGVAFFARDRALDLLAPANTIPEQSVTPKAAARAAAAMALSTLEPQVTPYRDAADKEAAGINLWLAAARQDSTPILLQARIPSSFFSTVLGNTAAGDPSTITLRDATGSILASIGGGDDAAIGAPDDEIIKTSAALPLFGWRVAATTPLAALNAGDKRNWMGFIFVTFLIATAALGVATLLSRRFLESNYPSPLKKSFGNAFAGVPFAGPSENRMLMASPEGAFRKPATRRPQPNEDRLRMVLGSSGVGAWQWDIASKSVEWDDTLADLLKTPPDTLPPGTKAILHRIDANDRRRFLQALRGALSNAQPFATDIRMKCFDGEERWFALRGTAMKDDDGRIAGVVGIAHDITDQKQSLSRTDALLREVSHRSKNMLALILAMARLTARDAVDVKSHLKEFALRVAGLAASQDLIVASDWQSVDLGALAVAEIEAVARTDATRVTINGPSFLVTPEAAQTIGMILTELTLNAVQHGALSHPRGEVRLTWEFPDDEKITISWQEVGGPGYDPEQPQGYGMSVVERFSTQGLKASANVGGDASGFVWVLSAPVANIGTRPPPHRT